LLAPARKFNLAEEGQIQAEIAKLLAAGFIESCQASYASQVLLVPKPDGSKRLCVDYRAINEICEGLTWPLPRINELLQRVGAHRWYAVMDLTQGYHQVLVHPDSKELTTFKTSKGTFRFNRVPFGLKMAPSFFQQIVQGVVLQGLEGEICHAYIDDIIVPADSLADLNTKLRMVFIRFRAFGIRLKRKKCSFGVGYVSFVGHTLSMEGHCMSSDRKKLVEGIRRPHLVTELRSFLGLANYFRDHLKNYATVCLPLNSWTAVNRRKNTVIKWSEEMVEAFDKIKQLIKEAPLLNFLHPTYALVLYCDASDVGVGGHLVQVDEGGRERSILFVSKALTREKLRWSTTDKEAYALVFAIGQCRFFLGGRFFIVRTDHQNLKFWMTQSASSRVERWKLGLQEYNFIVEYIKGESNLAADALSRLGPHAEQRAMTSRSCKVQTSRSTGLGGSALRCMLGQVSMSRTLEVRGEEEISGLSPAEVFGKLKAYHEHSGHLGVVAVLHLLKRDGVQWPNMTRQVRSHIQSCSFCQKSYDGPREVHGETFQLGEELPGRKVFLDTCDFTQADLSNTRYLMVAIDAGSRFIELFPIVTLSAVECLEKIRDFCGRNGKPRGIVTDPGTQFKNELISSWMKTEGIQYGHTSPASKPENGMVERAIRSVRKVIGALLYESQKAKWTDVLWKCMLIINDRIHRSIGCSPRVIKFGYGSEVDLQGTPAEKLKAMLQRQGNAIELSNRLHMEAWLFKQDKSITKFKQGDLIIIKSEDKTKTDPRDLVWKGPFQVMSNAGNAVLAMDLVDNTKSRQVHVSRCRPYNLRVGDDPIAIAAKDGDLWVVEAITKHRFRVGQKCDLNNIEVQVKWFNFDDLTWEPLSEVTIRQTEAFVEYVKRTPALKKFALRGPKSSV
jgi:transposase InsO family protein